MNASKTLYGLDAGDLSLRSILLTLRAQADFVDSERFESVGEFSISKVSLKPQTYDIMRLNRWQLLVEGKLEGLNTKTGSSVLFPDSKSKIYDYYYLNADEFSQMVKQGLYDDFDGYVDELNTKLCGQHYFRSTKANFEKVLVRDEYNPLAIGKFDFSGVHYVNYYIGTNLDVTKNLNEEKQTNFTKVLSDSLNLIVAPQVDKQENKSVVHAPVTDVARTNEPTVSLAPIALDNELELSTSSRTAETDMMNQSVIDTEDTKGLEPVTVNDELGLNLDSTVSMEDLSKSLSELDELVADIKEPEYYDNYNDDVTLLDPVKAKKARQIKSNSSLTQVRRQMQAQQQHKAHKEQAAQMLFNHDTISVPSRKNNSKDDGLDFG